MYSSQKRSVGLIMLIALAVAFISGCTQSPSSPATGSGVVQVINGVQEVTLSWGKLTYSPEVITVKKDMPVRITGDLRRLRGCFRTIEIPEFSISKTLTERDNVMEFTPTRTGRFIYQCGMGMGSGVIVVE